MLPSIFGENLFDDFFSDPFEMMMPQSRNPLYGKHAKNLMKTDVRETENSFEVDKLNDGRGELLRVMLVAQPLEPLVRHGHDADVGVDGAEGVVVRRDAGVGDGIEKRGFADIRQANDT